MISLRRINYPHGRDCKKKSVQNFFRNILRVPKMSHSTNSLSLCIEPNYTLSLYIETNYTQS